MVKKYIVVTGGIVSGIGKGITVASLAALVKARGLRIGLLKIDPYVNVDAGTMNPFQHGEVFVTDDGAETDLDLGHYERFADEHLSKINNTTTGKIYQKVIEKERAGDYLGEDVQLIPHVTDEVIEQIKEVAQSYRSHLTIVEVGGTVGDIEGEVFLEAVRQLRQKVGDNNICYIHITKLDYIYPGDEPKTKPIQHSVIALRARGINPDVLVVRTRDGLSDALKEKISVFTDVTKDRIIAAPTAKSIYEVPPVLEANGLAKQVEQVLKLPVKKPDLQDWQKIRLAIEKPKGKVRVAMVGKYLNQPDAYLSVVEALKHGGIANRLEVEVVPVDSERAATGILTEVHGILVPGGFGSRGIEGKISAIKYAREHKVPYLGLCLGLQCATIEYARSVCGLLAHSTEFDEKTENPVIDILPEQKKISKKGGTMRLGLYKAHLKKDSLVHQLYGKDEVEERHRHRYEINPDYHKTLEKAGFVISGTSADGRLGEFVELPQSVHPFFVGTQAHPEFLSRPTRAHPLFTGFIAAAWEYARNKKVG